MTRYLLIVALSLLVGYGLLKALPLLRGPGLAVSSPLDHQSFQDGAVRITGTANRTDTLTLDGAPLIRDTTGVFDTTLTFPHGGSILTFIATDRFGRRSSITRTIFVP